MLNNERINVNNENNCNEGEGDEPMLMISASGNLEKFANLSSINLKPLKRLEQDLLQPW